MSATCQSCGAPVEWALTHAGQNMPLDATPSDQPTSLRAWRVNGRLHVRDIDGVGATDAPSDARHATSHFATCPNADAHRKRKRGAPVCRTVVVDGTPVLLRGQGELTEADQLALAEVVQAAKRKYESEHQ